MDGEGFAVEVPHIEAGQFAPAEAAVGGGQDQQPMAGECAGKCLDLLWCATRTDLTASRPAPRSVHGERSSSPSLTASRNNVERSR